MSTNTSTPVTACNTYTWAANNQTYTSTGTYTNITTGTNGCQDTATLVLTINMSTNTSTPVTACNTYTWAANNQTYTSTGTYLNITTGANGCQDTATLVLIINKSTNTSTPVTACNTYTWAANGVVYTCLLYTSPSPRD